MKELRFPLVKISIAFITGILASSSYTIPLEVIFSILTLFFVLLLFLHFLQPNKSTALSGIVLLLLAFCVGLFTFTSHNQSLHKNNYCRQPNIYNGSHQLSLIIKEKLRSTNYCNRYVASLYHLDNSLATGKILFNVYKDSLDHEFQVGQHLQLTTKLKPSPLAKNPNQFDYNSYLKNKYIYAQVYADISEIKVSNRITVDIWYYTAKLRTTIINNLKKSNFNNTELSITLALLLGQQQDISSEVLQDYQLAGAVHMLSVSGLHIGLVLKFLQLLLQPIPNTKKGSYFKLIVILTGLFSFGCLAGMAPSVIRSVVMFSFVAVAKCMNRPANIFHTLVVSMLVILLFQPNFLFDVGFQLSYLAVFFIVWLQPMFSQILTVKSKFLHFFWNIITVSFAAQIGVLPLSLYYFHQFPGLFFITNLIVIPFLGLIMSLGAFIMVWAIFNQVPTSLVFLLQKAISIMNFVIHQIAQLENFILKNIALNSNLLILSYLLLITFFIWLKKPSFYKLLGVFTSIICLQLGYIYTLHTLQNQEEFLVLSNKKQTTLLERNAQNITVYTTDSILKPSKMSSIAQQYATANFSTIDSYQKMQNLFYFQHHKILVIDSLAIYPSSQKPDVLVLIQSPKVNLDRVLSILKPKQVVADASNYKNLQKLWKATCKKQNIPFHNVAQLGYFSLTFQNL